MNFLRILLVCVVAVLVGCGGTSPRFRSSNPDPVWASDPYVASGPHSISLSCPDVAREIGHTIRLQTQSGKVLVGTLRLVSCEDPAQLMMDVNTSVRLDSTAFVRLHSVSDIIVLEKTGSGSGDFITGFLLGSILGTFILLTAIFAS